MHMCTGAVMAKSHRLRRSEAGVWVDDETGEVWRRCRRTVDEEMWGCWFLGAVAVILFIVVVVLVCVDGGWDDGCRCWWNNGVRVCSS